MRKSNRKQRKSLKRGPEGMLARMLVSAVLVFGMFMTSTLTCYAASGTGEVYRNPETGYKVIIEDDAELFTEQEQADLAETMKEITAYGNVALKTVEKNKRTAADYAGNYYQSVFGKASGTLFLIDMDNREIRIHSDGKMYQIITTGYANTITDNVYRSASLEKYYLCASEAFEQINSLLRGQKIAQPMKYVSNLLLAVSLAFLINFAVMTWLTRVKSPRRNELLANVKKEFDYTIPTATLLNQTRTYSPGGSGGGHGGGRVGGGGRSGGGGGHRF